MTETWPKIRPVFAAEAEAEEPPEVPAELEAGTGRPAAWVECDSPEAAATWDQRRWHRVR